jgi:hypothetical protein
MEGWSKGYILDSNSLICHTVNSTRIEAKTSPNYLYKVQKLSFFLQKRGKTLSSRR